jgi:pimeloyl-ACP methyl ester carboxylesterase
VTARRGIAVDLRTGARSAFAAAARPDGYDNAIEASIPRSLLGAPADRLRLAVAAGGLDPPPGELGRRATGPAPANVAFRGGEPPRPYFDKLQAAALARRTIDPFFADVDLRRLRAGANQRATPGPGYYERVMPTDPASSAESADHGVLQPYGLYVPAGVDVGRPAASTTYLHGSGSHANLEPVVIPGLMRALGDARGTVVVAPQGRTAFSMWEGAAIEDVFAARRDAARAIPLDAAHSTLVGQSMGGYGAFLLAALFPDRFAATWSIEGLIGGFRPFPAAAVVVPDARRIFPNLRWVPTLIRQGGADFNVDVVNGLFAANALHALGYRSRLLLFPGDIHYTPAVIDRWQPEMQYLATSPVVDRDPPRVTYVRSIPFEREINQASGSDQTIFPRGGHHMRFDRAYWMRGLTPQDGTSGVASIDARSLAIPATPHRVAARSGAGESGGDPYTYSGDDWTPAGVPARRANAFSATLTGARTVTLDARRMRLDTCRPIAASIHTEHRLTLRLSGRWRAPVRATVRGRSIRPPRRHGALVLRLPAGPDAVRVVARCAPR